MFERISSLKIPRGLYELFLENDEETAVRFGNDIAFLKRFLISITLTQIISKRPAVNIQFPVPSQQSAVLVIP